VDCVGWVLARLIVARLRGAVILEAIRMKAVAR